MATKQTEKDRKLSETEEGKGGKAQFIKDLYRFTKTLLDEARSGKLTSPKEVVEEFLKESHSDTFRGQALDVWQNCMAELKLLLLFQHPGKEQRGVLYQRKGIPLKSLNSEPFIS